MVIEPMAHWWNPLHLQYWGLYGPGVGGDILLSKETICFNLKKSVSGLLEVGWIWEDNLKLPHPQSPHSVNFKFESIPNTNFFKLKQIGLVSFYSGEISTCVWSSILISPVTATMAEQTKKRLMTTDDETFKTSANPKKKKQLSRPNEGKQSKSNVTVSEEKPESASVLPCREGEHWKKNRDGGEVRYRCGSLSLGQELQIVCLLVIRFENNKRNRFIPWGLQLPLSTTVPPMRMKWKSLRLWL